MANQYRVGALVTCTGSFADSSGTAQDPTTVVFQVKTPAGATTTYTYGTDDELVKSSTGVYYVDVSASTAGSYYYRFYSTGTGQAADEERFVVAESEFD